MTACVPIRARKNPGIDASAVFGNWRDGFDRPFLRADCALKLRTLLKRKSPIEDVPLYVGALLHDRAVGANDASDLAANDNFIGRDITLYPSRLAKDDAITADISVNLPFDLKFAFAFEVAGDLERLADDGGERAACRRAGHRSRRRLGVRSG